VLKSVWWEEHDCAVASRTTADRLQNAYIDSRPRKSREDIGNGTGAGLAVNVKRRIFAQPELGLLCGSNKSGAVFGDEGKLRSSCSVLIAPERDSVYACVTQRPRTRFGLRLRHAAPQNAGSFADLVENRR
jgi:hypothetical protein